MRARLAVLMPDLARGVRAAIATIDGVLVALARYVELATGGREREREAIVAMRRELGLALEGAEASLERMLAEPLPLRHGEERAMYVVTDARRLGASITELLERGGSVPANVAAYLGRAIDEARGRAGDPATPPPPVPAETGAMELLVRRGELLARTAPAGPVGRVAVTA